MKKAIILLILALSVLSLCGCNNYTEQEEVLSNNKEVYEEVDNMEFLKYLKDNISNDSILSDVIEVFKEMCKTPIEEELLLLEYGVYDFTGEDLFYFDLVRQYPDGEGEYYQLRVSMVFEPDDENKKLEDTLWSDDTNEDFFDYISKSSGFEYANNHKPQLIDIYIDQT